MKGPYTIQRVTQHPIVDSEYVTQGEPIVVETLPDARRAVREACDETGIIPNVTDGGGHAVYLFTNDEIGRWRS